MDSDNNKFDIIKWLMVVLLVGGSIGFYYYFSESWLLVRVTVLLTMISFAAFIASKTEKGRTVVNFLGEAHIEVRKVVWPTPRETMQVTGIVVTMVILVALFVWLLDGILFWLVKLSTGQGG